MNETLFHNIIMHTNVVGCVVKEDEMEKIMDHVHEWRKCQNYNVLQVEVGKYIYTAFDDHSCKHCKLFKKEWEMWINPLSKDI